MSRRRPDNVTIIGGGIAGLACAVELGRSGVPVTLLEKSDLPGGRARSLPDEQTGDVVDIGPHILLSEYRNLRHLLTELATESNVTWQTEKLLTIVGKPHPVNIYLSRLPAPLHFLPCMLGLPQVSMIDLASNRHLLWQTLRLDYRDIERFDKTDAESCIRGLGVTEHFIEWFWRSACMAIMNVPLERCSAGALLRFFHYMLGRNDYQIGVARIGLGDLFVPGALDRIAAAGGRVLTGAEAAAIETTSDAVAGVRLKCGERLGSGVAVAAVPPHELLALLPPCDSLTDGFFRAAADMQPSPCISSYLWFDRRVTAELFWTRCWSPDGLNYDSYDLSNVRPERRDAPSLIASNIIYSERAANLTDKEIIAATVAELSEHLPSVRLAKVLHARVHRIPMAVPAPHPGGERYRLPNRTPMRGLFLAGDWTSTGLPASMESAVYSGYRAAEAVLSALGRAREIAIPPPELTGLARLIAGGLS